MADKTPAELLVGSFKNSKFKRKICVEDAALTGIKMAYSDMDYETALAAALLKSFYIQPGDTVSLLLEDGPHFFLPWIGAMRIGAVVHPVNYLYPSDQALYALELCETKLLVIQERYAWDENKNSPSELFTRIREKFPKVTIIVMHNPQKFFSDGEKGRERGAGFLNSYSWSTLMQFMHGYDHIAQKNTEDVFQLICTSGTTGKPKAVMQNNGMFLPNVQDLIKAYKFTGTDRTLLVNRLFHVNAQVTNFFPMVLLGGRIVLGPKDPAKFLFCLQKHKITYSSVIPPTLKEVLRHFKNNACFLRKDGLKHLRFLITGADILSQETHRQFMQTIGIAVRPGWGMTETLCWGSASPALEPIYYGSIGEPLPHTEFKIVNAEKKWEEVASGEWGRLIVRGENVFKGYFKNEEATRIAFTPSEKWGDGWFDTGDTCRRAKNTGIFYFGWRASADSWKVRGEFVNGPEIDAFLTGCPTVIDAMAVPVTLNGETETAICVVLSEKNAGGLEWTAEILEQEILEYCEEGRASDKLAKNIKIKKIIFVDKIELGDTGKKSRKKMAEIAQTLIDGVETA